MFLFECVIVYTTSTHIFAIILITNYLDMKYSANNFDMTMMVSSVISLVEKGYLEDYKAQQSGLRAVQSGKIYKPEDISVVDFHRFVGNSDTDEESILYAIETNDGCKGTLVAAFDPKSDTNVASFMQQVEEISKNEST